MRFTLINLQYLVFTIVLFLLLSCTSRVIENIPPNKNIINNINNIILSNDLDSEYGRDVSLNDKNINYISGYVSKAEIDNVIEIQNILESQSIEPNEMMRIISDTYEKNSDSVKRAYTSAMLYMLNPEMRADLLPIMYESFHYRSPPYLYVISYDDFNNFIKKLYEKNEELSIQSKLLIGYFLSKRTSLTFVKYNNESVSAAVFLRNTFLNLIFKGSNIDTMELLEEFHKYEYHIGDDEVYKFEYNLFSNDNKKRLEAENIIFSIRNSYLSFCTSANDLDFPYCESFKDLNQGDCVKTVKRYLFQRRTFGRPQIEHALAKDFFLPEELTSARVQAVVSLAMISHKNLQLQLN
jgi:hypothetical protein